MSDDGKADEPSANPPTGNAGPSFDSDEFKAAVATIIAEREKANPKSAPSAPAGNAGSVGGSAPTGNDLRTLVNGILDEREAKGKQTNDLEAVVKRVGELEEQLKKQGRRLFSIFDGL